MRGGPTFHPIFRVGRENEDPGLHIFIYIWRQMDGASSVPGGRSAGPGPGGPLPPAQVTDGSMARSSSAALGTSDRPASPPTTPQLHGSRGGHTVYKQSRTGRPSAFARRHLCAARDPPLHPQRNGPDAYVHSFFEKRQRFRGRPNVRNRFHRAAAAGRCGEWARPTGSGCTVSSHVLSWGRSSILKMDF